MVPEAVVGNRAGRATSRVERPFIGLKRPASDVGPKIWIKFVQMKTVEPPTQNPKIAVGYKGRAHSRARVCLTGKAEGPTLRRHAGFSMELVSVGTASRRLIVESGACFFSVLLPVCRVNPAPTTMKIKSRISAIMESDFMYLSCNSKITTPPYGATMTNYF